jgi:hypothetical protein
MNKFFKRLKKPKTKLGKFLLWFPGVLLFLISTLGEQVAEYIVLIPHDWIPSWLRIVLVLSSLVAMVASKVVEDGEVKKKYGVPKHKNPPKTS